MAPQNGWPALFSSAFGQSRNAMVLVDERRRVLDVNAALLRLVGRARGTLVGHPVWELVAGGPLASEGEWRDQIATRRFSGEATLRHAEGGAIPILWGATTESVAGGRVVLFVALSTSRWGARFRRAADGDKLAGALSPREQEVVRLVALGATGPEIADELQITHDTVRTHVRNAMNKRGARSRAHLVAKTLGEDLFSR
jgi:PAS domain S-box-containing protein